MFDLEPRVFPLAIFILCTWQWAAGDLLCGQRREGGGCPAGVALDKQGLQGGQRVQRGCEGQGRERTGGAWSGAARYTPATSQVLPWGHPSS